MVFTVVEWFVLVFAVIGVVKILFLFFKPAAWFNFGRKLYSNGVLLFFVELVLAVILFYYLLMEMPFMHIIAGVILGALLTGMSFALFAKDTLAWGQKLLNAKNFLARTWIVLLIWLAIMVWALLALFEVI